MDLLIHIGYHKTGSSWLQRVLFNQSYLGFDSPIDRDLIIKYLMQPYPFDFDSEYCKALFLNKIHESRLKTLVPVISREGLSGSLFAGGYNSKEIGGRIKYLFPNALILIVIREQTSMIASAYRHFIWQGGLLTLQDFIAPQLPLKRHNELFFKTDHFKYHKLIDFYYNLYGLENVLVLPYELLDLNPFQFLTSIMEFVNLDSRKLYQMDLPPRLNVSLSPNIIHIKRRLNYFVGQRSMLNPVVLFSDKYTDKKIKRIYKKIDAINKKNKDAQIEKMKDQIRKMLGSYFKKSNLSTAALTNINLKELGYLL